MFPPASFNVAVLGLSIVQASGFVPSRLLGHPSAASLASKAADAVCGESSLAVPCLEFYSGIGGLRVSLEKAVDFATCVDSFEISSNANSVSKVVDKQKFGRIHRIRHEPRPSVRAR